MIPSLAPVCLCDAAQADQATTTRGRQVDAAERDLILDRTLIDSEMEGRLRGANSRGYSLVVQLTLGDVDDLASHVAAEASHCPEPRVQRVLDAVYDRLANIEHMFTEEESPAETVAHTSKPFTAKQGQYLAYIYYYTKIHGRPPAESDLQRFFRVTPPVVHQMIKTLDARGPIEHQPGAARSIRLRLTRAQLPDLG
jgi:DNA-binding MarR family transcriptional regulator